MEGPHIVMKFALGKAVEVKVNGVKGKACLAFSKPFEDAIGGKVTEKTATPEMDQVATQGTGETVKAAKTF